MRKDTQLLQTYGLHTQRSFIISCLAHIDSSPLYTIQLLMVSDPDHAIHSE